MIELTDPKIQKYLTPYRYENQYFMDPEFLVHLMKKQ